MPVNIRRDEMADGGGGGGGGILVTFPLNGCFCRGPRGEGVSEVFECVLEGCKWMKSWVINRS